VVRKGGVSSGKLPGFERKGEFGEFGSTPYAQGQEHPYGVGVEVNSPNSPPEANPCLDMKLPPDASGNPDILDTPLSDSPGLPTEPCPVCKGRVFYLRTDGVTHYCHNCGEDFDGGL
jgi:hypothetical protein